MDQVPNVRALQRLVPNLIGWLFPQKRPVPHAEFSNSSEQFGPVFARWPTHHKKNVVARQSPDRF
jgi:hypothetical protein